MDYRSTKLYKTLDRFTAISIVEGFSGEENSKDEILTAWQYLLDRGTVWHLQGWYGRNAVELLNQGLIQKPLKSQIDAYGHEITFK